MNGYRLHLLGLLLACLAARPATADSTVVFNEIMYHPAGAEADLEWVELHNQMGVDMDISGWSLADGVFYTFPEGTIVPGGDYVVVASSPDALAAASGYLEAFGPMTGRLENSGERLELRNNSFRLMDSVRYRDEDEWPVAADGSGHSLAKIDPDTASAEASSWTLSTLPGGTPGAVNFNLSTGGTPLPQGLVSYWPFDDGGTTTSDDADGNDGTLGSGADRVPGFVGEGAIEFDNTGNAFINLGPGNGDNFSVTTGLTIEALIAPQWSGTVGDHDVIFRKEDGSRRILLSFQHDGDSSTRDVPIVPVEQPVLSFGINVDDIYSELDMPLDGQQGRPTLASLRDGNPHHVAATYDSASGRKRLYVDGALAFQATLSAGSRIASGGGSTAYIGNMAGRARPFTGTIDEVAFWERALPGAEIAAHHAATLVGRSYFSSTSSGDGPVSIAINEMSVSTVEESWIELHNFGDTPIALANLVLESSGTPGGEYTFPSQSLAAGQYLQLGESTLGFNLGVGEKLFLFAPGRERVLTAEELKSGLRGLFPDGTGRLLWPDEATPGGSNRFAFHDEIVINEIMYHPRSLPATPPSVQETDLVALDASWAFDDSGDGQTGTSWRQLGFNDASWDDGPALLYVEDSPLPATKRTPLTLGATTFYFRHIFEFTGDPATTSLMLRAIIDDGVVFYLNGTEIRRINMPGGAVTPSTFADTGIGDATFSGPYTIDAALLNQGQNVLAAEVHQSTANSSDVVFGAQLFASVVLDEGRPFSAPPESWIELYNRSDVAVDLGGWSLDEGVRYTFAAGTTLGPDEYIVIAEDSDVLRALFPAARIVGNLEGILSNQSDLLVLRDAARNPVDEVRYFDGDRWPKFADGGGSSLELRDPWADNSVAEAWDSSDEGSRSTWRSYSYTEVATANIGPTQWNEFILGLLDDGEVLLDDVSVVESPSGAAVQFISNSDFEGGSSPWRIIGNHRHSAVVDDADSPGNRVLHLVATGATEHMHNHAEITLAGGERTNNGSTYRVSFRAKWLAGSNQLNTRLYFNRVPETTLLEVPRLHGTPGEPNSRLESNAGPTYRGFRHHPVVPAAAEAVEVEVYASDPDGVADVDLWYSVNGGGWSRTGMTAAGNGLYRGTIPGQSASRAVQFYVEGDDAEGATSTFPRNGRESRALYRVEDGQADLSEKHNFRLILTPGDVSFLHARNQVMSNDRLPCTVIYDEREVYYDVGVRLKGSERGRDQARRVGYNVRFHRDQQFRGVHRSVAIDRSGDLALGTTNGQSEILVKHMIQHAGGIPGMYDDIIRVIAPRSAQTGPALLAMARYNSLFLDSQYENGAEGSVFEMELIYYPRTTDAQGFKLPEPDSVLGVDFTDHGNDKEVYRYNFILTNNRDKDDYEGLIRLCKTLGLNGSALEAQAAEVMDVSEWMRTFAMQTLCGIGDAYSRGNNHNVRVYLPPEEGRALAMPWDWDFAFTQSTSSGLIGNQNVSKVIQRPPYLHLYYGHLHDIIQTTYNTAYMGHWTAHYGDLAGKSYSTFLNYINSRRSFVLSRLPANVTFRITTNGGNDFTVDTPSTALEGEGWINVFSVGATGVPASEPSEWTGVDTWSKEVALVPGANDIRVLALDFDGNFLALDSIEIESTFVPPVPDITSITPNATVSGETVSVRGSDFLPGVQVLFGGVPSASVTLESSVLLSVVVPDIASGVVGVTVQNAGSAASAPLDFTVLSTPEVFLRGDFNLDRVIDISDALRLLFHLYEELPTTCADAGDLNDDEVLNLADVTRLLNFLFLNGPAPTAPFPAPGGDPGAEGPLDCPGGL